MGAAGEEGGRCVEVDGDDSWDEVEGVGLEEVIAAYVGVEIVEEGGRELTAPLMKLIINFSMFSSMVFPLMVPSMILDENS